MAATGSGIRFEVVERRCWHRSVMAGCCCWDEDIMVDCGFISFIAYRRVPDPTYLGRYLSM